MNHVHHPVFVGLSLLVAVFGSWTALDLFRRVRAHVGEARAIWLGAASVAMGLSIWAMHFIAMLGFDPGSPVRYDPGLTFLSLALAMGATAFAFFYAARARSRVRSLLAAGLAMGLGICLMHYVGMAALRSAATLGYDPPLVALSFLIAVGASTAALAAAQRERSVRWRSIAAVVLGAAIVGMHYTAMAALRLTPQALVEPAPVDVSPQLLAWSVALGAMVLLFFALLAAVYDRRLDIMGALQAGKVGYWELDLPQLRLHVSARGKEIFGRRADEPFTWADLQAAIAPDDAEWVVAKLTEAWQSGGSCDLEARVRLPGGATRWVNPRGQVIFDRSGAPRRMIGVVLDVTERHEAFAAVAESERRFQLIADSAPAFIWMTDAEGQVIFANRRYQDVCGRAPEEVLGRGWTELFLPEDRADFRQTLREAFARRAPFAATARVYDRAGRILWLRCEGAPRFDPDGRFVGYTGCNVDITEAQQALDRQQLLVNELNHRVKNTLATIQSIAAQTVKRAASPAEFREAFEARLVALSQTHNALTRGGWEGASLRQLLEQELTPYASEQIRIEGPDVDLPPRAALSVGMVLHELATNAAKHGALSTPVGCVRVSWRVEDSRLTIEWREENGPAVTPPKRKGFGSRLIEASIVHDLGGSADLRFEPSGVVCRLETPLSDPRPAPMFLTTP